MLARSLSGLLFFSVERHLDFRQGKLNVSLEIRGSKDGRAIIREVPLIFRDGLRDTREAPRLCTEQSFLHQVLSILYAYSVLARVTQDERFLCCRWSGLPLSSLTQSC